jgi:hypothetical protein
MPGRAVSKEMRHGGARLVFYLAVLVGVLVSISVAGPASAGVPAATASSLDVLWQVQAASVGLVVTLVVFVFGLLPARTRGMLTYRQFLRRTHAIDLTLFNVGSLLFIGLVLLGVGHQVPSTPTTGAHGWALTVATITALVSIGSIVVLLALTVRALDPAENEAVRTEYRGRVLAQEVRRELRERASLTVTSVLSQAGVIEFSPAFLWPGGKVTTGRSGSRAVTNVFVWRLRLLGWHASRAGLSRPVLRVWPGRVVPPSAPLLTIDLSSGSLARWWARRCIRTSPVPVDQLAPALDTLHAETLDDIRADRPVEAIAGMRRLAGLCAVIWQAHAAYGLAYDYDARRAFYPYRSTVGERLMDLLDDELRAAAVSKDEKIRWEASALPRRLAGEALDERASLTIQESLGTLLSVYSAAVSDLTEDGRDTLPSTRTARMRVQAPFQSLLSFTHSDLARAIERAASFELDPGPASEAADIAESARLATAQLPVAHRLFMDMVRCAVALRDSATVREALAAWTMPELPLLGDALGTDPGTGSPAAPRYVGKPVDATSALRQLGESLRGASDGMDAMKLQLLAEAIKAEAEQAASSGGRDCRATGRSLHEGTDLSVDQPDPVVTAVLDHFPAGRLWRALEAALRSGVSNLASPFDEARIRPVGVLVISDLRDATSPLAEAFALAAVTRPALTAGTRPSSGSALADGPMLKTTLDRVLATRLPWLERYGVPGGTARQRITELKDLLTAAALEALNAQDDGIRSSPISEPAVSTARSALRSAFHASDIAGALFAWAGTAGGVMAPGEIGGLSVFITGSAPRSHFIGGGDPAGVGCWLGINLAQAVLQHVLATAASGTETHAITPVDAAVKVREAIAQVRASARQSNRGHRQEQQEAARVVVIIPDTPYDLKKDIGVAAAAQGVQADGGRRTEYEALARSLGAADTSLARIAGIVDDAPVVQTRAIAKQLVVLDAARLRWLTPSADPDEEPTEPGLVLLPRGIAPAAGPSATDDTLKVRLRTWLSADVSATDPGAARVLTWTEWS